MSLDETLEFVPPPLSQLFEPQDVSRHCHYCHYCHEPLALFEIASADHEALLAETCRQQVTSRTQTVGARLNIPVYRIAYLPDFDGSTIRAAAVAKMGDPDVELVSPDELAGFIDRIHDCAKCRLQGRGRFHKTYGGAHAKR